MRRYRVMAGSFDTRSHFLNEEIPDSWDPTIRAQHWGNRHGVMAGLLSQFGEHDLGSKIAEFSALGPEPFSVLSYHNQFFRQTRNAFVIGSYYPALTAACALGERILNHLVRDLRDSYRHTPEFKTVYDKDSFDDWEKAISVLDTWGVLLPDVVADFRLLRENRNSALHFRPEIDTNARHLALEAIRVLHRIIDGQFGIGPQPWYIQGTPGETYVKGDAEIWPFVAKLILPAAYSVGPRHTLGFDEKQLWAIADVGDDGPATGTDDEFLELRRSR